MSHERDLHDLDHATGERRLAAHVNECEACRDERPPIASISAALSRSATRLDVSRLSARVLARLHPELERLARRAFWRRVAAVLLPALVPLPFVLACDAYLLRLAYGLVSSLLPEAVAAYLVLSYAALLALLFAATYAAIPLLVAPVPARRLATQE